MDRVSQRLADAQGKQGVPNRMKKREAEKKKVEKKNANQLPQANHRRNYTLEFKLRVVYYAEAHNNCQASRRFKVPRVCIQRWRMEKDQLESVVGGLGKKRMPGGGRKIGNEEFEKEMIEYVEEMKEAGHEVTGKMLQEHATITNRNPDFKASNGWLQRFMKRHGRLFVRGGDDREADEDSDSGEDADSGEDDEEGDGEDEESEEDQNSDEDEKDEQPEGLEGPEDVNMEELHKFGFDDEDAPNDNNIVRDYASLVLKRREVMVQRTLPTFDLLAPYQLFTFSKCAKELQAMAAKAPIMMGNNHAVVDDTEEMEEIVLENLEALIGNRDEDQRGDQRGDQREEEEENDDEEAPTNSEGENDEDQERDFDFSYDFDVRGNENMEEAAEDDAEAEMPQDELRAPPRGRDQREIVVDEERRLEPAMDSENLKNLPVSAVFESLGNPGKWWTYYEGRPERLELTEEEIGNCGAMKAGRARAQYLQKVSGAEADEALKWRYTKHFESQDSLFWDYQRMSHAHTKIQEEMGLGPVAYIGLTGAPPPNYKYIATNKVNAGFEELLIGDVNQPFDELKRTKSESSLQEIMRNVAEGPSGGCERPETCVCNERFELLFGEFKIQNLQCDRNGIWDLENFDRDAARMSIECSDRCGCSSSCPRRQLQRGQKKPLLVAHSAMKGFTVRSGATFKAGEFLSEYVGNLKVSMKKDDHSYEAEMPNLTSMVVCSLSTGNITRFLSHSCDPNAVFVETVSRQSESDPLLPRISLYAIKDISLEDEITIAYYKKADMERLKKLKKKGMKCLCESPNCYGFLLCN